MGECIGYQHSHAIDGIENSVNSIKRDVSSISYKVGYEMDSRFNKISNKIDNINRKLNAIDDVIEALTGNKGISNKVNDNGAKIKNVLSKMDHLDKISDQIKAHDKNIIKKVEDTNNLIDTRMEDTLELMHTIIMQIEETDKLIICYNNSVQEFSAVLVHNKNSLEELIASRNSMIKFHEGPSDPLSNEE